MRLEIRKKYVFITGTLNFSQQQYSIQILHLDILIKLGLNSSSQPEYQYKLITTQTQVSEYYKENSLVQTLFPNVLKYSFSLDHPIWINIQILDGFQTNPSKYAQLNTRFKHLVNFLFGCTMKQIRANELSQLCHPNPAIYSFYCNTAIQKHTRKHATIQEPCPALLSYHNQRPLSKHPNQIHINYPTYLKDLLLKKTSDKTTRLNSNIQLKYK